MYLVIIATIIFDLVIVVGTFYLIAYKDWSLWWILFMMLLTQGQLEGTKKLLGILKC